LIEAAAPCNLDGPAILASVRDVLVVPSTTNDMRAVRGIVSTVHGSTFSTPVLVHRRDPRR